jgi:hypothetical protein
MSDGNVKQLRGQVRQAVKDIMPEVLTKELATDIHKALQEDLNKRLKALEETVKRTLDGINKQHADVMAYLIRNAPQGEVKTDGETKTESSST